MKLKHVRLLVIFFVFVIATGLGRALASDQENKRIDKDQISSLISLAQQGNSEAQLEVGKIYMLGEAITGIKEDYKKAIHWLEKSASQSESDAELLLCVMHDEISSVRDYSSAMNWCRKASEHNFPEAFFKIGEFYFYGRGIAQDNVEAIKWWRKAAELGDATSQANLATAYYRGEGVSFDVEKAYFWTSLAAAQGIAQAVQKLSRLESLMTSIQLVRANSHVEEYRKKGLDYFKAKHDQ